MIIHNFKRAHTVCLQLTLKLGTLDTDLCKFDCIHMFMATYTRYTVASAPSTYFHWFVRVLAGLDDRFSDCSLLLMTFSLVFHLGQLHSFMKGL